MVQAFEVIDTNHLYKYNPHTYIYIYTLQHFLVWVFRIP